MYLSLTLIYTGLSVAANALWGADNGIGFDPKYNEKIVDVFQRLHRKKQYGGRDIGLAIVKKSVETHNGILVATGELAKVACFDMYMPVSNNHNGPPSK